VGDPAVGLRAAYGNWTPLGKMIEPDFPMLLKDGGSIVVEQVSSAHRVANIRLEK